MRVHRRPSVWQWVVAQCGRPRAGGGAELDADFGHHMFEAGRRLGVAETFEIAHLLLRIQADLQRGRPGLREAIQKMIDDPGPDR